MPDSATPAQALIKVALIGNPNTGKSTLFNSLAGVHSRIGNFPGVTVEKKVARVRWQDCEIDLIDLPGTYSLSPRSQDEMVSVDVLLGRQADVGEVDVIVCIADASNLERNLYLFSQLLDMEHPVVLVLNMFDVARDRQVQIDVEALARRLGVPIVVTEAHRRRGLDELRAAVLSANRREATTPQLFPPCFADECRRLDEWLREHAGQPLPHYLLERLLLDSGGHVESKWSRSTGGAIGAYLCDARQRLKQADCPVPVSEAKLRYAWIREQLQGVFTQPARRASTLSDRIDRILTHRFVGLLFFAALMFVVFQSIYQWSTPLMDLVELVQSWAADQVAVALPPGVLRSLIVDGAIAGVGSVLVFLPQIVVLFLFIAVLEDCGYMARAAFLMDKLMSRVGLSGKSFVPLMSSFACAIPGVMATRVIENRRDRMVTILVAPLMSCSARLPVYLLLVAAFVPPLSYLGGWITLHGMVLFAMSALGAVVAVPVAWLLKKTIFRGETPPFVMELPEYKWPSPRIVAHRVYDRGKAFVVRAGTLIFATNVLVWAAGYFPGDHAQQHRYQVQREALQAIAQPTEEQLAEIDALQTTENQLSAELIRNSALGLTGRTIEPLVEPLGWDWRIGVGAIASFPAREVIIATLGTIYSLGGDVEQDDPGLQGALRSARRPDGSPVYNLPVALSIMVFFALCAQCGATLMVIKRETNSWRWPIFTFLYMTTLAYVGALVTYQVGRLFL